MLLGEIMDLQAPDLLGTQHGQAMRQDTASVQNFRYIERMRLLVLFDLFIGGPDSETMYEWDWEQEIPQHLCHIIEYLYQQL
jgi:hypothetical protein